MKTLAAICPCCQAPIILGDAYAQRSVKEDEAVVFAHLEQHTMMEWVECVAGLRREIEEQSHLRNFPRIAMPRA